MAVRNISLKDEAYNRLRSARRYRDESFSEVVLRATWPEDTVTAGVFLRMIRARRSHLSDEALNEIEEANRRDAPPEDKWAGR